MMQTWRRVVLGLGLLVCAAAAGGSLASCKKAADAPTGPETAPLVPLPTADPARVSLLVFGDWGQNTQAERDVAAGIRSYAAPFDAGLLLGDNFYFSLTGVDDPRWQSLFENLYEPASLRFFALLGNHDYSTVAAMTLPDRNRPQGPRRTNKDVELEYARLHPGGRWNLPDRWYRIDLPADAPLVTVLMLDGNYDQLGMSDADWQRQIRWLRRQLDELRPADATQPRRRWVICCAHQPFFTNGSMHSDDERLKRDWLPILESHGVDFYLAGHNHCMEHLQVPGSNVSHIVSGGGGARLYRETRRHPGWFGRSHGFTHLILTDNQAEVRFLDQNGQRLYSFTRDTAGEVKPGVAVPIPATQPSDLEPYDFGADDPPD